VRLNREEPESPEINITPLIDVVFLLLIFFMVSTTFSQLSELKIELPEADADKREQAPEVLEVAIDVQGRYFVNGRPLVNTRVETLVEALKRAREEGSGQSVVISADARTPHQAVVSAMDAAQKAGIARLSFATVEPGEPAEP
jgi:biopolymer transport protein ExbD